MKFMEKFKKPEIGDYLKYKKFGLLVVHERGVFVRDELSGKGSEYSIMKDADGNIVSQPNGHPYWFYDDFLTEDNFKVK